MKKSVLLIALVFALILIAPLFSTPRPVMVLGHPWKVELLSSLFLFVLLGWSYFRDKLHFDFEDLQSGKILPFFAAFIIWSGVSVFWAASPGSVIHHTLAWSIYLILFLYFLHHIKHEKSLKLVTTTFALCSIILGVVCLIDYSTVVDFSASEGSLRIRYGKYAELLITILPLLWAMAFYARNFRRSLIFLLAGIGGWLTIMLSLSKGAFLSGIAGFAVLFAGSLFFGKSIYRRKAVALAAIWLAITVAVQVFFSIASPVPSTTDYISGTVDATRNTSVFRVFTWKISEQMIADNWMTGVGADNFGLEFNESRKAYAEQNPLDVHNQIAEDHLPERAHNEFLQIFAELGIAGFVLFAGGFGVFAFWVLRTFMQDRTRISPVLIGCIGGITAFFVSSMFSSFSFRAMQNGLAFFAVLSVAVNELAKAGRLKPVEKSELPRVPITNKPIFAAGCLIALAMALFSFSKALSQYYVYSAERTENFAEAEALYRNAVVFDPESGSAYFSHAARSSAEGEPRNTAALLKKAIENGIGVTLSYSLLAENQSRAGDIAEAEGTMKTAVGIFPHSVFARVRYALILEENGYHAEARKQMETAATIDAKQASGWYSIIKNGSVAAFLKARNDPETAQPSELLPANAVFAFLDEMNPRDGTRTKIAEKR